MAFDFGPQMNQALGLHGDFTIGSGAERISAKYLLTKIRPGASGDWSSVLASHLRPWREVFDPKSLTFDELVQRDLDDSRVAHDLIPYLLGTSGERARFFPPILAVLVPKSTKNPSGIADLYPKPAYSDNQVAFGDIFQVDYELRDGHTTPFAQLRYNPQRSAFVIVDGQHRAMAVLALHRQLTAGWQGDSFASYYQHLEVDPDVAKNIELPVCVVYFPDLSENDVDDTKSNSLVNACREIFLTVNKQAKVVGRSRELLLDDGDFAAAMMRRTLSKLTRNTGGCEIVSVDYADGDAEKGGQVQSGQLEYCSAVALHRMHAATGWASQTAFSIPNVSPDAVTDLRKLKWADRAGTILNGHSSLKIDGLPRYGAKARAAKDVKEIVESLGEITDAIVVSLFDGLRPFQVHNAVMRDLDASLSSPSVDATDRECRTLLLQGGANRKVKAAHRARLNNTLLEGAGSMSAGALERMKSQLKSTDVVLAALEKHEKAILESRCFRLFNIKQAAFMQRDSSHAGVVTEAGRSIFNTVSTQAFQIGYLMAVLGHVELVIDHDVDYYKRLRVTKFVSACYLAATNTLFPASITEHESLKGYIKNSRAKIFQRDALGFRGILSDSGVTELNEKQWIFFRYVCFETLLSTDGAVAVKAVLDKPEFSDLAELFKSKFQELATYTAEFRAGYLEKATAVRLASQDNQDKLAKIRSEAQALNLDEGAIESQLLFAREQIRNDAKARFRQHLSAALGSGVDAKLGAILARLDVTLQTASVSAFPPVTLPSDEGSELQDNAEGDSRFEAPASDEDFDA